MDYLPKLATIEQACAWLHAKTGQTWILARLLECHLTPHFWVDHKPGYPQLFGHHTEGYLTRMVFQGDLTRLEADGADALVQMFTAYDDTIVKVEPAWRVPVSELRFKREAVERVAEIINCAVPEKTTPGTNKRWTPERLAELKAYRDSHTMPQTAVKFGITEQRIRQLLPTSEAKPKTSLFPTTKHRIK